MENQEELNLNQHPIKWGAVLGLIAVVITLLIYLVDVTMLIGSYMSFVWIAVFVAIPIYAGRDYRTKLGGYLSFKNAFLNAFIILLIGGFIVSAFEFVLYNFIDSDIIPILVEIQIETTMKAMEALGGAGTEMMDGMAEGIEKGYSLAGQAQGFLYKIAFYAIGALIIGAINKKKDQTEEF